MMTKEQREKLGPGDAGMVQVSEAQGRAGLGRKSYS